MLAFAKSSVHFSKVLHNTKLVCDKPGKTKIQLKPKTVLIAGLDRYLTKVIRFHQSSAPISTFDITFRQATIRPPCAAHWLRPLHVPKISTVPAFFSVDSTGTESINAQF